MQLSVCRRPQPRGASLLAAAMLSACDATFHRDLSLMAVLEAMLHGRAEGGAFNVKHHQGRHSCSPPFRSPSGAVVLQLGLIRR